MRPLLSAIGVLLLLALLTSLLLRGTDTNAPAYAASLQAADDFALAEASLHRDVLQARAGLLRDYDSLGKATDAMEQAVARLRAYAAAEKLSAEDIDRLAAMVARSEDLTERFKSSNALLQNSLSYVGQLSTGPAFGANDEQLAPAAGALAAAILHLTRDTSPDTVAALQERIDQFAAQAPSSSANAEAARALLAHARLLHDLLPAIDITLKALVAVPSGQALAATRALFVHHQAVVEDIAQRFRLALYIVSLLLVVMLVRFGIRLRRRARALRQRAAFEHIIAENSTRLINCPPEETAARLQQVLGEFGKAIGADRAYLVLAETPMRIHVWAADGVSYPHNWPGEALALCEALGKVGLEQISKVGLDVAAVRDVTALPPSEAKDKLLAAGIRAWACVALNRPGRVRGMIGFDKSQLPAWGTMFPLAVARLAGDAVANAIEREFLERDRERLATRLERARRMQMVGTLASGIAHNFNNIIGTILGYSEMIEPQLAPGTKPARHVDEIRRAAERGRDLIDNILGFGRRHEARVERVAVRSLFSDAAAMLRPTLPANVELIFADAPADVALAGEPAQLQQIILNLCTNAAQAIEGEGRIVVAAERKDLAAPLQLSHGNLTPGRYVCLSVSDTGRGFDESVARRLFEPFFTTRTAGTGLGLATVLEIVRDHNGAMNVQSRPGQGSRFETWLPLAGADLATAGALPLGKGETVMIVERERERLLRDEEMLAALGYEPIGFTHAADAIAAYRSAPDRLDALLISDAGSHLDSLEVARTLHKIGPRAPILLATVATIEIGVDALTQAGIAEILRRPLASAELAAALGRCVHANCALPM